MNKHVRRLRQLLGLSFYPQSETSKVRHLVKQYCIGKGCDIGHGSDKIVKNEDCWGIDLPVPYTKVGKDVSRINWDMSDYNIPIGSGYFSYVYSSHFIEDFPDTMRMLFEMFRVLRSEGYLILVFPDQSVYDMYTNGNGNEHHIHPNMGMNYMRSVLLQISHESYGFETHLVSNCDIDYNCIIVVKKLYKKYPFTGKL